METQKFSKEAEGFRFKSNKNIIIFILSLVIVVVGFIAFQQNREKTKLISEYQSERNATESYLNQTFQTIESNLAEIRVREGIIESNLDNPESTGNLSAEEKIQNEIQMIESIMEKNKALIADLNLKVDNQNADLIKYKNTISQTNKKLESFKQEVANLMAINEGLQGDLTTAKSKYSNLESDYQTKIEDINSKSQIINEQLSELQKRDLEMNKVFYTVGEFKELNEENLVEKEGGILGIGSTKVLANSLDQKKFIEVDRRDLKVIPVHGKKVELVTKHDITSYEIVMKNGRAEKLVINNPEAFWRDSKYLIVLVKDQDEDLAELKK
jgi:chromosome segregation ATPase